MTFADGVLLRSLLKVGGKVGFGSDMMPPQNNTPQDTGPSELDIARILRDEQRKYEREQRQRQIIQTLQSAFSQYGLQSLFPKIQEFARRDLTEDGVLLELRKTPEYKARFPAMEALAQKQRAITEAEYIEFERNAAQLERAYGLPCWDA